MNTSSGTNAMDRKVLLSTLWVFVVLNYLYCDVVSLMDPNLLKQYLTGTVGSMKFTPGLLLGAGVLMAMWIAMVLLSRVLKYGANRWVNIIAGALATLVQLATLVLTPPAMYYLFFSVIEMAGTLLIVWFALRWRNPTSAANEK
jgi:Family of unknown function (DUF6326)